MQRTFQQWLLTLLGLSGVLALFIPYSAGQSVVYASRPLVEFIEPVIAFPFLILGGHIARLLANNKLQWMNGAGYSSAILVSVIALSSFPLGPFFDETGPIFDAFYVAIYYVVLPAFCITLGIVYGFDADSDAKGLVALQSLYAFHLSFYAAVLDFSHYGAVYWLAWMALLVSLGHVATLVTRKRWIVSLFAPSAFTFILSISDF